MKGKKYFIITIDTEGDNLWDWKDGDMIYTENTRFLSRFQSLCDSFGFKPVWLTNYEMINDARFVDFIANVENSGRGELGMHLHAWNTPPSFQLQRKSEGAPYLIEYPPEVMEAKISVLTELIQCRTGIKPTTHRSGRWATNQQYFDFLIKYGYNVDCSVTPHISWETSKGMTASSVGSNYQMSPEHPFWIHSDNGGMLLEVPMTVRQMRAFVLPVSHHLLDFLKAGYRSLILREYWLRPTKDNLFAMKKLVINENKSDADYIMFMLHSSELMPGGSPSFRTVQDIDNLYKTLETLFDDISSNYKGITLREYYEKNKNSV